MPIISYLATPIQGEKSRLFSQLQSMKHCEAVCADNEDLIVLVTDTPDEAAEKDLQRQLKALSSLQTLSMAYGHADNSNPNHSQER
ncbi:MAG: hypothetical protein GY866_14680 [Proteobacteria bacterium]|nr:hypothetical protein [Pseudomonadota bacterium]